ncbi:MAG: hypothetical protein LBB59_02945 [Campylobacteraceae bacterium]|jgi:hypothetical protein|nr:hypothetical protein [Campylobacteraceae bacterium]
MSNHKQTLLMAMSERGQVTAAQFNISNANAYFNELKREGICKGEWNETHTFKWWRIIDYNKAKRYLNGIRSGYWGGCSVSRDESDKNTHIMIP